LRIGLTGLTGRARRNAPAGHLADRDFGGDLPILAEGVVANKINPFLIELVGDADHSSE
jgi:hypothetical protein